jgi:hypothetical protein
MKHRTYFDEGYDNPNKENPYLPGTSAEMKFSAGQIAAKRDEEV